MICECCGRELTCNHCDEDRRQGEEFVAKHGMPDNLGIEHAILEDQEAVRRYIASLNINKSGWYD